MFDWFKHTDYEILVKTGDNKNAGTDANVYCQLVDSEGKCSKDIKLDVWWRNDFEKGNIDNFNVKNESELGDIVKIIVWRDSFGLGNDWFVEYFQVKRYKKGEEYDGNCAPFPCNRWLAANKRHTLLKYDSFLPQLDERVDERKEELVRRKKEYEFGPAMENLPRRLKNLPSDEQFSNEYRFDITGKKIKLLAHKALQRLFTSDKWDNLSDLLSVYKGPFKVPYGYYNWKSDENFGDQRLRGCAANNIELCTEIPEKFAVTEELVAPHLNGMTLKEAMENKLIYIVDLGILDGVKCKNDRKLCAPFALFLEKDNGLAPLAIQLDQEPAENNPVFTPSDPEYTWMLAKMYFNNAECSLHQACTHLGFTHLVCETVTVCVNRTLSISHPVYRLMAPHFLYLLAINSLAVEKLLSKDGWIDVTMTMGVTGLFQILERKYSKWRFDVHGWFPNHLKARGVDDKDHLKAYHYRDDSLLFHDAIHNYVSEVLKHVYDTPEKLKDDHEIQEFARLLVDPVDGCGMKGVFGDGKFEDLEDLIKILAGIIFLCSVGHAAANFCQYDEYAFPANYPATLHGPQPTDKSPKTEQDVVDRIPNKDMTLSIMVVTKILSDRGTNGLGDFEVQYQYEPHAVAAVERFRKALDEISAKIDERNKGLKEPYSYLHPKEVPNAISI